MIGKDDGIMIKEAIHHEENKPKADNETAEDANKRLNRDWVNLDSTDRDTEYKKRGHQVIMQGIISGKIPKGD